jgi:hypothetical protein
MIEAGRRFEPVRQGDVPLPAADRRPKAETTRARKAPRAG